MSDSLRKFLEKIAKKPSDGGLVRRFLQLMKEEPDSLEKKRILIELAQIIGHSDPVSSMNIARQIYHKVRDDPDYDVQKYGVDCLHIMMSCLMKLSKRDKAEILKGEIRSYQKRLRDLKRERGRSTAESPTVKVPPTSLSKTLQLPDSDAPPQASNFPTSADWPSPELEAAGQKDPQMFALEKEPSANSGLMGIENKDLQKPPQPSATLKIDNLSQFGGSPKASEDLGPGVALDLNIPSVSVEEQTVFRQRVGLPDEPEDNSSEIISSQLEDMKELLREVLESKSKNDQQDGQYQKNLALRSSKAVGGYWHKLYHFLHFNYGLEQDLYSSLHEFLAKELWEAGFRLTDADLVNLSRTLSSEDAWLGAKDGLVFEMVGKHGLLCTTNILRAARLNMSGPECFGEFLDLLVARGKSRRALFECIGALKDYNELPWAQAIWKRLPDIWRLLSLSQESWEEREGVAGLARILNQRNLPLSALS